MSHESWESEEAGSAESNRQALDQTLKVLKEIEAGVREKECVFGRDNVSSGETMSLRERQCPWER